MTMKDLIRFVELNWRRIVMRGVVSILAIVAVTAVYLVAAPGQRAYVAELHISLESSMNEAHYPDGSSFSMHDLLSLPVLDRVWREQGLETQGVSRETFATWFSIVGYGKKSVELEEKYDKKMSKKNISITELDTLQREYEKKLTSLRTHRIVLSMKPTVPVEKARAAAILDAVPKAWFNVYSVLRAPNVPDIVESGAISAYVTRIRAGNGRALELIDTVRYYMREVFATCGYIRQELMRGRKIEVAGHDIEKYESQLAVMRAELIRLKNRLMVCGGDADLAGYVESRIDAVERERLELDERTKAVGETLDMVSAEKRMPISFGSAAPSSSDATPIMLQADAGFLADFASMIRRDLNQALLNKYTEELTDYRKAIADFDADKLYYDQIENYIRKSREKPASPEALAALRKDVNDLTDRLLAIGAKVVDLRDKCIEIYRTPEQFYVVTEPAAVKKSYDFPLSRFVLGLLAIAFLGNLVGLVKLWNRE